MSIHIQIAHEEGGLWKDIWVSGRVLQEIQKTGYLGDVKLAVIKFDDGKVWNCVFQKYEERKK